MVGLEIESRFLVHAYSIVSPNYEEHLEFYCVITPFLATCIALAYVVKTRLRTALTPSVAFANFLKSPGLG